MKDLLAGLPVVAKAGAATVLSLIALYLVYVLTAGVASAAQVDRMNDKLDQHVAVMKAQNDDQTRLLEALVRLGRLQCISAARTETMRIECSK